MAENALFFREYLRHFHATGAVLPSSRYLASALARFVDAGKGDGTNLPERPEGGHRRAALVVAQNPFSRPRTILEVGPGTGAVTRRIIRRLGPNDRLDLVELNETFVRELRRRFRTERGFRAAADRARILHCPVEELPDGTGYDVIVSGLPLNNFSAADVKRILGLLTERLAPGGVFSFFEYIAVRRARSIVSGRAERTRLREIGRAMSAAFRGHEYRREAVWLNIPPARVHHLRKYPPPYRASERLRNGR